MPYTVANLSGRHPVPRVRWAMAGVIQLRVGNVTNFAQPSVDLASLDRVVAKLRKIQCRSGIERTMAIGELVLNEFYGGDHQIWKDRRRNKSNSIRRLAERRDCPLCKSALNEAVGIYVAVASAPAIRTFGHITSSHIAAVLPLPAEDRVRMLEAAWRENWSVRETKERVSESCRAGREQRSRRSAGKAASAVSSLDQRVHALGQAVARVTSSPSVNDATRVAANRIVLELSCQLESLKTWSEAVTTNSNRRRPSCTDEEAISCRASDGNGKLTVGPNGSSLTARMCPDERTPASTR